METQAVRLNENSSKAAAFNTSKNCRAITPAFSHFAIQPKLTINQPNDVYEQEADRMADQVMQMTSPAIQTKPVSISSLQRKCALCEAAEEKLQRKETNSQDAIARNDLESYVGNLSSGGQALPDDVRSFYEPRFGYDFSNVKVHTDTIAAKSAQSVNALAYTNGNNIIFNDGQYSPGTDNGKRLLAHELTHVVQQGGAHSDVQRLSAFSQSSLQMLQRRVVCPEGVSEEEGTGCYEVADEEVSQVPAEQADASYPVSIPEEQNYTPANEENASYPVSIPEEQNYTPANEENASYPVSIPEEQNYTPADERNYNSGNDILGMAGGPYHPPVGTELRCTGEDTCSELSLKINYLRHTIKSHQDWDAANPMPAYPNGRHFDEIQDLSRALRNCINETIRCRNQPEFVPVPQEAPETEEERGRNERTSEPVPENGIPAWAYIAGGVAGAALIAACFASGVCEAAAIVAAFGAAAEEVLVFLAASGVIARGAQLAQ